MHFLVEPAFKWEYNFPIHLPIQNSVEVFNLYLITIECV